MSAEAPKSASVDWPALLKRLEAAGDTQAQNPAEVLRLRARELAAVPASPREGAILQVLGFQLSGESYAVEASFVEEIFPLLDFTPLFCTPPFVLGVTNLRGKIVSIVDLRRFFELPAVGLSDLNRVILVSDGTMEFGLLADGIAGMREVPLEELQSPPAAFTGIREEFLAGVTAERLALLDLGRILADRRLVVREEVE